jgi:hypothetical protein
MPHITLNSAEPGIRGLLRFRPETGRPLSELAEVLLRGPGTLTRGERELVAAYVSGLTTASTARPRTPPAPQPSCRRAWSSWIRSAPTPAARRYPAR